MLAAPTRPASPTPRIDRRIVVGSTSNLLDYEGLDLLIEAVAGLERVSLLLVGDGAARDVLRRKALSCGVELTILDRVPYRQVPHLLRRIDVFAIPRRSRTITRHASPIKLIEAMAAGRAIVAFDVGDIAAHLADGRGLIAPTGDLATLRKLIVRLRDDEDAASDAGRRSAPIRGRSSAMARRDPGLRGASTARPWVAETGMRTRPPSISVIMPLYNAQDMLGLTLPPLTALLRAGHIDELLIVDDGSTDDSRAVATGHGGTLFDTGARQGPAAARNLGAEHANGDILWFIDSDVVVADGAQEAVLRAFDSPEVVAMFGSYDDTPAAENFLSQYKNLVHHHYHQQAKQEASTFWSGCGAVRRSAFRAVGGFDARQYPFPSIEDIELGYRLLAAGGRIRVFCCAGLPPPEGLAIAKSPAYGDFSAGGAMGTAYASTRQADRRSQRRLCRTPACAACNDCGGRTACGRGWLGVLVAGAVGRACGGLGQP